MRNKNKILIIILIIVISLFILVSPVLFQEGNPMFILKGIIALDNENDIVKISDEPQKYLTKTDYNSSPIITLFEEEGWTLEDQLGSGYIFSKDGSKTIVIGTQYTKKYTIWELEM